MQATRLQVLHIVPAPFDAETGIVGGAERYAHELARHMAEVIPTALLTFGKEARRFNQGALQVIVERAAYVRGQRTNPWTPAIAKWVRRARIVHCHQQHVLASSTAALVGRLLRTPVFVSDLGGGGWDISGYLDTSGWYRGHIHISDYSRKVSGHSGRPDAHVVWGGVDHELFSPSNDTTRDGSVLYVGRLMPHKGVNYLIEAMGNDVPLRILGSPYDPRFHADLQTLARGRKVEFVHGASDGQLVAAYRRASVLVLPSVYRTMYDVETRVPELLGQTLLEAMACETPVICTNVASMPEVVVDGATGFIVPPNDSRALRERILWLLAHPRDAEEFGRAARQRVLEAFTWPRVVSRCLEIYGARADVGKR